MKDQFKLARRFPTTTLLMLIISSAVAALSATGNVVSDLSGSWIGTIKGQRQGTIELTLSREGEEWKAEVKVELTGLVVSNPVVDLKVTETDISFRTEIAGADALFTGRLEGSKIVGSIEVTRGGRLLMKGNWTAERSAAGAVPPTLTSPPTPIQVQTPMPLQNLTVSRTQIAFSFAGDLWVISRSGGEAKRLTTHPADEVNPAFSPDGSQIAFTRSSGPDADVYIIPSGGGEGRRLTYHPKQDIALGWTPDGGNVLFASARERDRVLRLYTIPSQGGFLTELPFPMGVEGSFSPDGTHIAYLPYKEGSQVWRNYRGGLTSPIWIAKLADSSIEELPRDNSNDRYPMWLGNNIYFVSDRNGTANLFVYNTKTKKVSQLTKFEKYDIRSASACDDAIVFVQGGGIHLYDLKTNQARTVDLRVTAEFQEVKPRMNRVAGSIQAVALSPSGSHTVFSARGEILMMDAEKGGVRNLTRTTGVAERYPSWSPDGRSIAYFSDESGEYQLHIQPASGEGSVKKIAIEAHPSFYKELVWSPDSSKLAFSDKRLALWTVDRIPSAKVS